MRFFQLRICIRKYTIRFKSKFIKESNQGAHNHEFLIYAEGKVCFLNITLRLQINLQIICELS